VRYTEVSLDSVLIGNPRFSGVPCIIVDAYFKRSDNPLVPGMSDAKYKVFSSTLSAGCATLYSLLLKVVLVH
jgi:hypothetical protein